MKQLLIISIFSLGCWGVGRAQSFKAKTSPVIAAQMKSDIQSKMAYNSETGNLMTAGITNQVKTPLALTADQQKGMNQALYDFFTEKSGFLNLKKTDETAYQAQEDALLSKLTTRLSGFLSADQVRRFLALKPAAGSKPSQLNLVFY